MELKKVVLTGIIAAVLIIILDFIFFFNQPAFMFIIGVALLVGFAPFILNLLGESKRDQEISSMFLEFTRNLAESVVTGTPISRSIINMSKKNYGPLSPYIQKMTNQISLGIPVNVALQTFAEDVNNRVIKRAVALIIEAEKAGGEIDYILESVAKSIAEVEKLKKERRAAMFNLIMQGYIIFFIFIGIMLVMEFKILPLTYGTGNSSGGLFGAGLAGTGVSSSSTKLSPEEISRMFLYLLLAQGFFAGLVIGKLSEGSIRSGIKHSFILTAAAYLISTGAGAIFS